MRQGRIIASRDYLLPSFPQPLLVFCDNPWDVQEFGSGKTMTSRQIRCLSKSILVPATRSFFPGVRFLRAKVQESRNLLKMKTEFPAARLHRFNLNEYYQLGELGILDQRTELIEGIVVDMEPIVPWHASILDILNQTFCEQAHQRFRVRVQLPIDLDLESLPQPDLVLCRLGRYRDRHPIATDIFLVIEVADTSLAFDLGEKRTLYSDAGIAEYWVIDVKAKKLTRFLQEGKELVEGPVSSSRISPIALPDVSIDLAELFG
jgi:Uma2 family endonuclease